MQWIKNLRVFYRDRLNFWLLNVVVLVIILTWSLFLFKKIALSPLAVLHYNIYFGLDVIGNWPWLFLIPGISLAVSLLDFILAFKIWTKQPIWSHFLLTLIFLINLMVFIYLLNIINYNL